MKTFLWPAFEELNFILGRLAAKLSCVHHRTEADLSFLIRSGQFGKIETTRQLESSVQSRLLLIR